jgi:adenosylcobinamide-phosphate synthase
MTDMAEAVQNIYFQISKPYALLMLAFTLDLCLGDPVWLPHPVRIMGKAITKIEELLRKHLEQKGDTKNVIVHPHPAPPPSTASLCEAGRARGRELIRFADKYSPSTGGRGLGGGGAELLTKNKTQSAEIKEKRAGIVLVVIIASLTSSLFYVLNSVLLTYHFPLFISYFSLLVMVFLTATTLAAKGLIDSAQSIIKAVMDKNLKGARIRLSHIVGRDTDTLDEKGILKATIESLAENASDGIIAPLFYFAIGGLPLAITYKAINTMDSMVGYKNDKYKNFGWAAAKLDDIANYIPARITGMLISISSAIVSLPLFICSLKTMFRDGRKHPSPNSGVPEAAMAGALGVRLGGPSSYWGLVVEKPYIGKEIQDRENLYLAATKKAITITKITSLLGLSIAIVISHVRTAI